MKMFFNKIIYISLTCETVLFVTPWEVVLTERPISSRPALTARIQESFHHVIPGGGMLHQVPDSHTDRNFRRHTALFGFMCLRYTFTVCGDESCNQIKIRVYSHWAKVNANAKSEKLLWCLPSLKNNSTLSVLRYNQKATSPVRFQSV